MNLSDVHAIKNGIQIDLEEAKALEIVKLQISLDDTQKKVDETNTILVKEREAAKKAIEEAPPVIKETTIYIEDTEKIKSLTDEVDGLKVMNVDKFHS